MASAALDFHKVIDEIQAPSPRLAMTVEIDNRIDYKPKHASVLEAVTQRI